MHLCRSSSNVPRLPSFLEVLQNPHVWLTFDKVQNPLPQRRKTTPAKVVWTWFVFTILTWKCASRQNDMRFQPLDFKKCSEAVVFCRFHFHMCLAPQRRLPKMLPEWWFSTFWLRNMLLAAVERTFSTSQLPKAVRTSDGFAPATLTSLRFDPPEPQNIGKTLFCDSRTCIFFLLTLSFLWSSFFFLSLLWLFPPLLFHLSILSKVWLLNFLRSCDMIFIYIYIFGKTIYIYTHAH